ncbi:biotin--[acetyl-CoA-carboxylase] ligase [Rhodoblastus acidophilus]|uniref:biotin--[biotin carboxyl-carrier protein] ligase n=1 Tax=Candidatus Rhodoblastus alkanivorans TaxID=2954117 RepID=A0ABS9Z5J4_9HYPH|nr:biotin--[acetyl-CoA-carboxylase] ligase [Candidatus Rhodoblastus alkanivorans]MCI4682886.1 biotin--[acetyl-CoA-carboxylase] ligase [Candidatus Rhodoblastus alkanivorans]
MKDFYCAVGPQAARAGYRLEVFTSLASTNDEAMSRIAAGDPGRLWIVAATQTRGRGRMGRVWNSPPGNLYASLLLVDPAPPARLAEIGFVAGVALIDALRVLAGPGPAILLKWPNDALGDGAKLSGLLLEGASLRNGQFACVVGVGVNCQSSPVDAPYPTASLRSLGAASFDRGALFAELSERFAHWLEVWSRGANFSAIRAAWLARAGGLGERAQVTRNGEKLEGIFRGIDAQGRMLLEKAGGAVETIEAGDVAFDPRRA